MKKATIILLIIMIVSFTVALVLVGIQIQNIDDLKDAIYISVNEIKEIDLTEEVNRITLDSETVDILNIYSTKEDKIKIEVNGEYISIISKGIEIYTKEKEGSLEISVREKGMPRYISLTIYNQGLMIDLYIPESYSEELKIDAYYDDIYIDDAILEKVKITGLDECEDWPDDCEDWLD